MRNREEVRWRIIFVLISDLIHIIKLPFSHERELYVFFRNIIGFYPRNLRYYNEALIHSSAQAVDRNGKHIDNERLEYLGDAVLTSVVSNLLFRRFPERNEGFLTDTRAKIIKREHLNQLGLSFGIDNSTDASGSMHTDYSFKFAKRFWNNRLKIIVGGKVSSGADVPNQNESFIDNVTFEYRLGDTSNKYLRLFYDNNSYDWLEGTTQEFGVGFTWRKTMQHFKDLFRKERKMQMPAAPQRPASGDSTKTPLVNREIK